MAKRLKKESKFHKFVKEHFMIVVMIAIMLIPSIYTARRSMSANNFATILKKTTR